jgi:alpha(1,3/1,4) fucosyltransferase
MKPTVRLRFCDFAPIFNLQDNYFTQLLGERYQVEIADEPDFLIYSCFGNEFQRHRGIRIYYTAENRRPNFTECDYAFSFDFSDHPNHMRLPFWRFRYPEYALPIRPVAEPQGILRGKTRFCNFVYSNHLCPSRNRFFRLLSKYKSVDAAGKLFNNIGGVIGRGIQTKLNFIQQYKFTIAFENESYSGYTTEKLYEALFANTLPIY